MIEQGLVFSMQATSERKPKLIAVDVPWQVSPTTSYLRLRASESDDDSPTEVSFVGYFGPVALPDWEPGQPKQTGADPAYYRLKVVFQQGRWARFSLGIYDADPIDESRFDVRSLRQYDDPRLPIQERGKALWDVWRRSGRCPDPRMYEVIHSEWIASLGKVADGDTHFIIVGHDSFVEVVAQGWRVETSGSAIFRLPE